MVAQKVTDLTSLGKLVYDVATDKQTRADIANQFQNIKDQIGDNPKEFFPILGEVILTVGTGNTSEEWEKARNSKDNGEKSHLATRGVVNTVFTAATIFSSVKELPKFSQKLGEEIKKVKKVVKQFVNNPFDEIGNLKPNVKFKTGEFEYFGETDELGRLERFETENLQLTKRTDRLTHNPNTPDKLEGDHSGHIFGDRFGGSPELDNLVSQSSNVNLSSFKKIENKWAKAISNNEKVQVEIKIKYNDKSKRPSSFEINYKIGDEKYTEIIKNN